MNTDSTQAPLSPAELLQTAKEMGISAQQLRPAILHALENGAPDPDAPSDAAALARRKSRATNKKKSKKKKPSAFSRNPLSRLELHQAHCTICGTRHQEEIEDAFLNWESVDAIARSFGVRRRAIYRHAHATGLFPRRDRNICRALGLLIQRADKVYEVTADHVIRAAKTLAHINERGEWTTPPTRIIFSSDTARPAGAVPRTVGLLDTPAR